jgi:hypothetical protein
MEGTAEATTMTTSDYVATLVATLATLALVVVMARTLGKHFSESLNRNVDVKVELLRRLSHRR